MERAPGWNALQEYGLVLTIELIFPEIRGLDVGLDQLDLAGLGYIFAVK